MRLFSPLLLLTLAACNQAPEGGAVRIEPAFPDARMDLVASVTDDATDPNGDAVEYLFEWSLDGQVISDLTGDTVPSDRTRRDQVWSVSVLPSDGSRSGPALTDEVTIVNAPPTVELTISPVEPLGNDDLVASVVRLDADDDIVDVAWSWTVDGVPRMDLTGSTVPAAETFRGQVWEVRAQPSDEFGVGPSSSASVEVGNAPPVLSGAALTPTAVFTDTFILVNARVRDDEGDRVTTTVSWLRDGVDLGVTDAALAPTFTKKGDSISARLVAFDGFDESEPVTAGPIVVRNSPPTPPELFIQGGTEEDDLICEVVLGSADLDNDAISYTFAWTVDGVPWTGATVRTAYAGDTIAMEDLTAGQQWTCTVTASDGEDAAAPVSFDTTVGGGNVSFRAGYYFVKASYRASGSDHASVCSSVGLRATSYEVTLTWDSALLSRLSGDFGYRSLGDINNSARTMWCYDAGSSYPSGVTSGDCETHNFGSSYENYGFWGSYTNQRPVFTCTR